MVSDQQIRKMIAEIQELKRQTTNLKSKSISQAICVKSKEGISWPLEL